MGAGTRGVVFGFVKPSGVLVAYLLVVTYGNMGDCVESCERCVHGSRMTCQEHVQQPV